MVDHTDARGELVFQQACKMGLEGIVSKRRTSPYRSGPEANVGCSEAQWRPHARKQNDSSFSRTEASGDRLTIAGPSVVSTSIRIDTSVVEQRFDGLSLEGPTRSMTMTPRRFVVGDVISASRSANPCP
jgi:hypothetical protein